MADPPPAPSSSPPIGPERVHALAERTAGAVADVLPLAGDASTRCFYRVRFVSGRSLVAMVLGAPFDPASHPQVLVGNFLESIGFPVPGLAAAFPEEGALLYEDMGETLLEDLARGRARPGQIERLYEEAVDLIALLQGPGTDRLPPDHPSARAALDRERFLFELGFFREHYVERLTGRALDPAESRDLESFFEALATDAERPPRVLCHRDYHARNLMVWQEKLRVIDFQDARLGPPAYDLASLLRDSYIVLPPEQVARLIDRFVERSAPARSGSPGVDRASFQERFDVVALQRNLKAIGTFGYQVAVLGRERYRESIEPTWSYVFDTLGRLPAYSGARALLARIAAR